MTDSRTPSARATARHTSRRLRGATLTVAFAVAGLVTTSAVTSAAGKSVNRFGGTDRIETAIEVYEQHRASFTSSTVLLTRSDEYSDALAATPLAAALKAPILTTGRHALDSRVADSIKEQRVTKVFLIGGEAALSPAVEGALKAAGVEVERVAGRDRFETALLIADHLIAAKVAAQGNSAGGGESVPVFLATGLNFADAMAAGAAAAKSGGIVLLTHGERIGDATLAFLRSKRTADVTSVGGEAAQAANAAAVPDREVVGRSRYETAIRLALLVFTDPGVVVVVSGETFGDALPGGAFAAVQSAPLLFTPKDSIAPQTAAYLADSKPDVAVLGGPEAVSEGVMTSIRNAIAPPALVGTSSNPGGSNVAPPPLSKPETVATTLALAGPGSLQKVGQSYTVTGTLQTTEETPSAVTGSVDVTAGGVTQSVTAENGHFTATFAAPSTPATVTVTARFAGDSSHAASDGSTTVEVGSVPETVEYARDTFDRTVSESWGDVGSGGTWWRSGGGEGWSQRWNVKDGAALLALPKAVGHYALLPVADADTDTTMIFGADKAPAGGGQHVAAIGRYDPANGHYRFQIQATHTGAVECAIKRIGPPGSKEVDLTPWAPTSVPYAVGDKLNVRMQVTGTTPTAVRGKVWKVGDAEPPAWTATYTDATPLLGPGRSGVFAYLSGDATNDPVTFSFDDIWMTAPRD